MLTSSPTALALLLAATAPSVIAQTIATAPAVADRPGNTPAGTVFTLPKGWTLNTAPALVEAVAPEGDVKIAIVDVGSAKDATAAAAAAWMTWAPAAARTPKVITARAAKDGWDERAVLNYETSPNEKRTIQVLAFRAGTRWSVVILDAADANLDKRGAAAALISQSVRPAGFVRESFAGRAARPMDAARIAELKAFVDTAMKELGIPGVSFALTDRTRTIYSTGLGVRELGKPAPVDADSQYMIASNTKGLSTLLLARLVDEGKLKWDQPVVQVYPAFRLGSPETTAKVQIRHLVCACTGLPRKDLEWIFNTTAKTPASDTFSQLAATQPTSGFGEVFQYNNLMASAAGYVGANIVHPGMELGAAYDRAMDEKVFRPLGMTATTFDFGKAQSTNWARPHADDVDGHPTAALGAGMALNRAIAPFRPAGGAWSSANDLVRYVRFELNDGRTDAGEQWVSAASLLQRRVPNVPTGEGATYGMGLETSTLAGVDVIHHGGSLGGYKSDIMLIPGAEIGAVLLTNSDNGGALLRPFLRRLLELLYDGKPEAANDVAASAKRIRTQLAAERAKLTLPPDAAAVAALAPAYASPELGRIDVRRRGDGLAFRFSAGIESPMASRRNDDGTVSFVTLESTLLGFPFVVASVGGRRQLIVRDSQHEYRFAETN